MKLRKEHWEALQHATEKAHDLHWSVQLLFGPEGVWILVSSVETPIIGSFFASEEFLDYAMDRLVKLVGG